MSGPSLNHDLSQRQTQGLVLTPQLRQSLKILQVAATDLRSTIRDELQNNPTLEESDAGAETTALSASPPAGSDLPSGEEPRDQAGFDRLRDDWRDDRIPADGGHAYSREDSEKRQHFLDSLTSEPSLQEHLLRQAQLADLNPEKREALRYLIGSLDDRGFLTVTPEDAAQQSGLPLPAMEQARNILRGFDPLGIGSASLPECLLTQLAARQRGDSLAARIVRDHFDLLTRRRIPELARLLAVPVEDVQKAIGEIGLLDPAPGRRFAEDHNQSIEPDVTVTRENGAWKITLNTDYIPRLRISNTYRTMLAKGTLSDEERAYLRERMRAGKFIIDAIAQRQQTVERITRALLQEQADFFEHGVSRLKPLTMTRVADEVGVHETTVSRAVANKYIRTPHGVFPFRFFFTAGYRDDSGADIASTSVKELIADLIALEDRANPLSDQEIVLRLQAKGLNLARRTVAKYRESLGIPSSNLRRDYA